MMMYSDITISQLSGLLVSSNKKEPLHLSVRRNDGETSKDNNEQGVNNYWTCQNKAGGYCRLRGGVVAPAQGEAAIAL